MCRHTRWAVVMSVVFLSAALATPAAATPQLDTIDDAVAHIKQMYDSGDYSRFDIARELSSIVDQRVRNANSSERMQDSRNWKPWMYGTENDPETGLDRARGRSNHFEYERAAKWVWKSRYGACEECSCLSYYILKHAGVDENVRIVSSTAGSSGHNFVVWGMQNGAKTNDPSTWGDTAYVVDGWQGQAYTNKQAVDNEYIGDDGEATLSERTNAHDKEADVWKEDPTASSGGFPIEAFCFVATAVYGTPDAPELRVLRTFRDEVLRASRPGRSFVGWYYREGPNLAEWVGDRPWRRWAARAIVIDPTVRLLEATESVWR